MYIMSHILKDKHILFFENGLWGGEQEKRDFLSIDIIVLERKL